MANFPSVWLLEQHSALQHPHLTIHDDKPYLCGLCGQKSRYACCRYRTVLAKHHRAEPGGRSRVPADKLFTCDVCGMQFRYLKSFKKHRLNHALERLHGKKGSVGVGTTPADSEPAVSSTNESSDGVAASSAMVADLRSLTACADGDAESVHGDGGACGQEKKPGAEGGEIVTPVSTVTGGGEEQDDTVSDSALNQATTIADSAGPSSVAGTIDDTQTKISSSSSSSSSNSATSTTRSSTCHSNGISNHCTNGGGSIGSCQTNSNSASVTRMVQSPMEAANETLLAGELKRYQAASVAAVAAAAAAANSAAAHHHASVVRSMEAESSSTHAPGGNGGGVGSSGGGVLQHGLPSTGSSTGPSSLSHTLNSLINAETIPHHRLLGLDPQEASILNFLRVDAAEKQRDRRFACPFCGKCVRSKENLKLHVRKHTGERPFVCLFCGRAFGGKSDLTRHLRIHTGERPYHCEACGKCFARADYLSKHLTTHVHQLSPRP
ncbi:transcription factor Sp8-like [Anopheles funestus]|nr:transcription factor Sp8-like [Anopheles funestus]